MEGRQRRLSVEQAADDSSDGSAQTSCDSPGHASSSSSGDGATHAPAGKSRGGALGGVVQPLGVDDDGECCGVRGPYRLDEGVAVDAVAGGYGVAVGVLGPGSGETAEEGAVLGDGDDRAVVELDEAGAGGQADVVALFARGGGVLEDGQGADAAVGRRLDGKVGGPGCVGVDGGVLACPGAGDVVGAGKGDGYGVTRRGAGLGIPVERWGILVPGAGARAMSLVPVAFSTTAAVCSAGEGMSPAKAVEAAPSVSAAALMVAAKVLAMRWR
ncbi:hypothetical protein [Streptomyces sp. Ac-502]|uniref:hypothetical protein n=1 Tax=Streptomyces sp. Ac-502 TaxID=3342801 RepID=UPI003862A8C7